MNCCRQIRIVHTSLGATQAMKRGSRAPENSSSRSARHHLQVAQTFLAIGTLYIGNLTIPRKMTTCHPED